MTPDFEALLRAVPWICGDCGADFPLFALCDNGKAMPNYPAMAEAVREAVEMVAQAALALTPDDELTQGERDGMERAAKIADLIGRLADFALPQEGMSVGRMWGKTTAQAISRAIRAALAPLQKAP